MKIVFIGTVKFSREALKKLIDLGADVAGAVTKRRSDFNADFADLSDLCQRNDIPVKYTENVNDAETAEWVQSLSPDVVFCFGWSQLIGRDVLSIPRLGVVGYHPTLLPRNRGRHPLIWALALGLKKTGSTFFFMDEGPDSGDILSQREIEIQYRDDAQTLYDKITLVALGQIEDFLPRLKDGTFERKPQNEAESSYWRKRSRTDGEICFEKSSREIYNLVRSLTRPYVGAHLVYGGKDVKVWRAQEVEADRGNPGEVLAVQDKFVLIKCAEGAICFTEHEFDVLPEVGELLNEQSIGFSCTPG